MLSLEAIVMSNIPKASLCKSEVLASGSHGRVETLAEILVTFIFRKIKLCNR
jgi:hypothetical protein